MNVMMAETVEQRVIRVIAAELKIGAEELVTGRFTLTSAADSLTKRDLIFALEIEFNQDLQEEEAVKLLTVSDVINYYTARVE
ncbi:MAG: hypothetical protein Q7K35_02300 [bacterium]|nr:hypothetical protein [bacterium]